MLVAAMQHVSPKRPFNRDIRGQIQTVLSLRDAGTNERRDYAANAQHAFGRISASFTQAFIERHNGTSSLRKDVLGVSIGNAAILRDGSALGISAWSD